MKIIFILFIVSLIILVGAFSYFKKEGTQYNKIIQNTDGDTSTSDTSIRISRKEMNSPRSVFIRPLHELPNGEIIEENEEIKISIAPNNSELDFLKIISKYLH